MLGAAGSAEVDGDGDQAFHGSGGGAHGGKVDHGGEGAAVATAEAHFEAAHAAGREGGDVADVRKQRGRAVGRDFRVRAEGGHGGGELLADPGHLTLGEELGGGELFEGFAGAVPEHALGGRIE